VLGAFAFNGDRLELFGRKLDVVVLRHLVAIDDIRLLDVFAGFGVDLFVADAVAGFFVELVEADLLALGGRGVERDRAGNERSVAPRAESLR
jgi:hypothetical protein